MPDSENMAKLAEALELPVAYFHAVSKPMAEAILVMSQLSSEKHQELIQVIKKFRGLEESA